MRVLFRIKCRVMGVAETIQRGVRFMVSGVRTKHLYARTFKRMLEEMPFTSVKITDLCERCQTTTQNFYYHFHDKYELAAWIFTQEVLPLLTMPNGFSSDVATKLYEVYFKNRDFYSNLFREASQYSIVTYMREFTKEYLTDAYCRQNGCDVAPSDIARWICYHSYGMVGLLYEWITGAILMTPEEFGAFQFEQMPEVFRNALGAYAFDPDTKILGTI